MLNLTAFNISVWLVVSVCSIKIKAHIDLELGLLNPSDGTYNCTPRSLSVLIYLVTVFHCYTPFEFFAI